MGLFDSIRRVVGGGESATDDGDDWDDGDLSGLVDTSTLDEAALRRHAEDVAGEVEQLDFSLDSLAQFDSAIDAGYDEELEMSDDPATYATDVVRFGCYLGEVIVRRYGGEWTSDPQWGVTITGPEDSATVSVFEVAQRSIETKAVFAAVTERAAEEVGLDPDDAEDMPESDEIAAVGTDTEAAAESTDSSPTIDPDDWDESDTASQTPVPDDESEPADSDDSAPLEREATAEAVTAESSLEEDSGSDSVAEGPESSLGDATEAETTVDDSASPPVDESDEDESAPSLDVETDTDDAEPSTDDDPPTDDEPPISEVAESEYGFEFESAADRETEPDGPDESDEPATEPLSGDSEPTEPDEPVSDTTTDSETETPLRGTESSGDSTTDGDPSDDGIATPAVEDTSTDAGAEEPSPDAETEDTSMDADDVAGLVEEAEPDTARRTAASESLFDEAESPTTAEQSGPSDGESATAQPEADDPTQGDGMRAEYASEAEAFVSFWNEHDLDYTPESLERLDDLVAAEWDDDRFDDAEFGSEETFDDRAFTSVSRELGSYFGEVLVRELDGEWTDETTNDSVVVTGPDGPLAIPVFRVAGTSLKERPVFARSYDSLLSDIDS